MAKSAIHSTLWNHCILYFEWKSESERHFFLFHPCSRTHFDSYLPDNDSKKEKTRIFVQNDLFWTHTAKTKHFLVEFVLKRPPFIFKIRVCFANNFLTQMPSLYLKSDAKKSEIWLFSKMGHNLNFFQKNLLKRPPQNQKNYEDFVSHFFF